jgi:hypothetical protein
VAVGLEVGPDMGGSQASKIFTMNAMGALVINREWHRGDIDVPSRSAAF